jgi:hypothetical protein
MRRAVCGIVKAKWQTWVVTIGGALEADEL